MLLINISYSCNLTLFSEKAYYKVNLKTLQLYSQFSLLCQFFFLLYYLQCKSTLASTPN